VHRLSCHHHDRAQSAEATRELTATRFVGTHHHSNSTIQIKKVVKMFL
jgi:hypothetical protein